MKSLRVNCGYFFGGDKGGQHMKFHFECVNTVKAGSVDNGVFIKRRPKTKDRR